VVRPDFPANSVGELVAAAKAKPGSLDFASAGSGTSGHLTMEVFQRSAGIKLNHVAYKGGAPAMQDLLAGVIHMMATNQDAVLPQVKAGKLKALAVTSVQRNPAFPGVPSFVEAGFKDMVVTSWGVFDAPRSTPPAVVERLRAATLKALKQPELRQPLEADGWVFIDTPPAEFAAFVRTETERWARIIQAAGIRIG
jgi:tripartite-type tricarboxylate transporter receptor subunit TctC